MIRSICPKCSSLIKAGDNLAGQVVVCPKCGETIRLPPMAAFAPVMPVPLPPPPPENHVERRPVPSPARKKPDLPTTFSLDEQGVPDLIGTRRRVRRGHSFGLASIFFGAIGLMACWIPVLGFSVAGLGVLLAFISFSRGESMSYAVSGMVLSTFAVFPAGVFTIANSSDSRPSTPWRAEPRPFKEGDSFDLMIQEYRPDDVESTEHLPVRPRLLSRWATYVMEDAVVVFGHGEERRDGSILWVITGFQDPRSKRRISAAEAMSRLERGRRDARR